MRPTPYPPVHALEEAEDEFETIGSNEVSQDEVLEMELATQLLEITNDSELEEFINEQLQNAAQATGPALPRVVLQPLAHALKKTLKHTIRSVGDSELAAPNPGGHADPGLAVAANVFGLELEGLSPEDQEFELARRFVRLTRSAGRRARRFVRRHRPRAVVRRALVTAARRHAPGLVRRRRRPRSRLVVPIPVVYTDPEPLPAPDVEPVMDPEPAADPAPEPDTSADPNTDSNADADSAAGADTGPDAAEEEFSSDQSGHGGCKCARCRGARTSGRWARRGGKIILRDV
jgi:hypothetical protein